MKWKEGRNGRMESEGNGSGRIRKEGKKETGNGGKEGKVKVVVGMARGVVWKKRNQWKALKSRGGGGRRSWGLERR